MDHACAFALQLLDLRLIIERPGCRGSLLRWRLAVGRAGVLVPGRAGCRERRAEAGAFLVGLDAPLDGGDERHGFGDAAVGRRAPPLGAARAFLGPLERSHGLLEKCLERLQLARGLVLDVLAEATAARAAPAAEADVGAPGELLVDVPLGGERLVDMPLGDPRPRGA